MKCISGTWWNTALELQSHSLTTTHKTGRKVWRLQSMLDWRFQLGVQAEKLMNCTRLYNSLSRFDVKTLLLNNFWHQLLISLNLNRLVHHIAIWTDVCLQWDKSCSNFTTAAGSSGSISAISYFSAVTVKGFFTPPTISVPDSIVDSWASINLMNVWKCSPTVLRYLRAQGRTPVAFVGNFIRWEWHIFSS